MDCRISIFVNGNDIKKYIKNSKLDICDQSINIKKVNSYYRFKICLNTLKKINMLNNMFDFFIKHKWYFHIKEKYDFTLYDIDKDLYYKSGYWFLNSDIYDDYYSIEKVEYLALTHDSGFVKHVDLLISRDRYYFIILPIHKDLYIVEMIFDECKQNMSKKNFDILVMLFYESLNLEIIENYGIIFFKLMRKYNVIKKYISYLSKDGEYYFHQQDIIRKCLKLNKTDILDYLKKYGLFLEFGENNILIDMIKNDNIETFNYTIVNIKIDNETIQKVINWSGEFITKEYVEILFNNGKLDNLDNLELLKKSIKNNPDKNLKKYVRKLK